MPTEIVPGVHDITCRRRDESRMRVFLFDHDVPTLVDTGLPGTTDAIIAAIADLDTEPDRLVITHGDGDHMGGFDALVDRYDPETWVPEQTSLDTDHDVDQRYGHEDRIGPFTAVHVPGHTPDNHVLIDEAAGVAVMGDALCGADQRGLPAGFFHLPPGVYSADLNAAEANLDRLLSYDFEIGLVFHGSSVTENADQKLEKYVYSPG